MPIAFLPLLLAPLLYGALVKLSALLMRRARLRWSHALIFGFLAIVVSGVGAVLNVAFGRLLPMPLAIVLGLALQLALGGWYLGPRATNAAGEPLQFKGGALLSLIAYLLIAAFGVTMAVIVPALQRG